MCRCSIDCHLMTLVFNETAACIHKFENSCIHAFSDVLPSLQINHSPETLEVLPVLAFGIGINFLRQTQWDNIISDSKKVTACYSLQIENYSGTTWELLYVGCMTPGILRHHGVVTPDCHHLRAVAEGTNALKVDIDLSYHTKVVADKIRRGGL